jgi:hypothetical protein
VARLRRRIVGPAVLAEIAAQVEQRFEALAAHVAEMERLVHSSQSAIVERFCHDLDELEYL